MYVKGDDGWQEAFPFSLTLQALFQLSVDRRRYHELAVIRATMSSNISFDRGRIWPPGKAQLQHVWNFDRAGTLHCNSLQTLRILQILHLNQDMRHRTRISMLLQHLRTQGGYKPTTNTFLLAAVIPIAPSAFLVTRSSTGRPSNSYTFRHDCSLELMRCRTAMGKDSTSRLDFPDQQT